MSQRLLSGLLLLLLALSAGCATYAGSGTSRTSSSRDMLTAEEIDGANIQTAYEAVQRLRNHFLQARGTVSVRNPSATGPVVYVDGMRRGGLDVLHSISAADVLRIQHLSAGDATTRYGTGHAGGVLLVETKDGRG